MMVENREMKESSEQQVRTERHPHVLRKLKWRVKNRGESELRCYIREKFNIKIVKSNDKHFFNGRKVMLLFNK